MICLSGVYFGSLRTCLNSNLRFLLKIFRELSDRMSAIAEAHRMHKHLPKKSNIPHIEKHSRIPSNRSIKRNSIELIFEIQENAFLVYSVSISDKFFYRHLIISPSKNITEDSAPQFEQCLSFFLKPYDFKSLDIVQHFDKLR